MAGEPNELLRRIEEGWTFEKIEPMSTEDVFVRLNRLGVAVTPDEFRRAAQRHDSAERLADEWRAQYVLHPENRCDEDFVWMAAIVLWRRLIPDRVSIEQIDGQMQKGYELSETDRITEACDAWWQVWGWLKEKVTPERNTLAALDETFRGSEFISNWCQDFDEALENASVDDPEYHRLRIRYCREFLDTFSDLEWLMRGNFLRAEAESYFRLGEAATAEAKFQALVEANPDWSWGYVGWSDEYWLFHDSAKDYDRAERILRRALERSTLEERNVVLERLKRLQTERAQAGKKKRRKRRRKH